MTPVPIDPAEVDLAVETMFPDGSALAFDIRAEEGSTPIVEVIRARLDAGIAVGLWDSAGVMPAFGIGRTTSAYLVTDGDDVRGSFATVEAALKHGLTMWDGYRIHGRTEDANG